MKLSLNEPGVIVSGLAHVALLAAALIGFSQAKPFEEAQESVPVDIITENQVNEITKGTKTAPAAQKPAVQATKQADIPEPKPRPPEVEAQKDVPTPPPSLKREPDPGQDETPAEKPVPTPPQRVAALPPPTPTPPVPTPPLPEPRPTPPQDAEAVEPPKPQPRPKPDVPTPPKPDVKPVDPKQKADLAAQIAKVLDAKPTPTPPKPPSRPKSGEETPDSKPRMNSAEISKLLSKEPPGQKASSARDLSQTASLGAPNATAARMSPSLWAGLDGLMLDQYKQCWTYLGLSSEHYIPQIKVEFKADGGLAAQPSLLNPPSDPALRSLAESAMRAVRRCDPLKIPAQYAPYFQQWKSRILRFDPAELQG